MAHPPRKPAPARKTNWFAIWVSTAVVVLLVVIGGVVVWMNNAAAGPGAEPSASNIDTSAGAVVFGSGSNTVDTYIDFMCPYCQQFEESEGSTIQQLVSDGKVTLRVHPVTILDSSSQGTEYSSRAASAFYAVAAADPDNAYAFMQALYTNKPDEGTTGLTDAEIISIAKKAGVNMTSALEKSITSHDYLKYAQAHGLPSGATGTPTVLVNGTSVNVTYNAQTDIVANLK